MFENFYPIIFKLISRISGEPFDVSWWDKLPYILRGGLFGFVFVVIFIYFFRKYIYRYNAEDDQAKAIFKWTLLAVLVLIFSKYVIFHFFKGYIPDRLLFFGLPSPRIDNIFWFLAPIFVFLLFLKLRKKIEMLPTYKFLSVIFLFFSLFTFCVAGMRDGILGVVDPLTRIGWEYTGALPQIQTKGVRLFLNDFSSSLSTLPVHAATHPPGYILFLYFWQKLLDVDYLGLAVVLILTAGLVIFPVFGILKQYYSEISTRRILQIFIFLPSLVMFSATSMEAFFITLVWVSIYLVGFGWQRSMKFSIFGGFTIAYTLFSNYLFLLLVPFFLILLVYLINIAGSNKERLVILVRSSLTFFSLLLFFVVIWRVSGYSIVDNFLNARIINSSVVESNFVSLPKFFIYLSMNISSFLIFLGLPIIYWLSCNFRKIWAQKYFWSIVGFCLLLFFLLLGIFQGEVERIWLFMVPFILFVFPRNEDIDTKKISVIITLLFFQIILFQTFFYTYW